MNEVEIHKHQSQINTTKNPNLIPSKGCLLAKNLN